MILLLREKIQNLPANEYIKINDHNIIQCQNNVRYFLSHLPFECESFSAYVNLMADFPEYFPPDVQVDLQILNNTGYNLLKDFFYIAINKRSAKNIKWGLKYNICRSDDVCINLLHHDPFMGDEDVVDENADNENNILDKLKFAYYSGLPLGNHIFQAAMMKNPIDLDILNWLYDTYVECDKKIPWGEEPILLPKDNIILDEWLRAKNCPWIFNVPQDNNVKDDKKVNKVSSIIYVDSVAFIHGDDIINNVNNNDIIVENQVENQIVENHVENIVENQIVENIENQIIENQIIENQIIENNENQIIENQIIEDIEEEKVTIKEFIFLSPAPHTGKKIAHRPIITLAEILTLARTCCYDEIKKLYHHKSITYFDPEIMNIVTKNGDYDMMYWLYEHGSLIGDKVHHILQKRQRKFF